MRYLPYLRVAAFVAILGLLGTSQAARVLSVEEDMAVADIAQSPNSLSMLVKARLSGYFTGSAEIRLWKRGFNEAENSVTHTPVRSNQPYNADADGIYAQQVVLKEPQTAFQIKLDELALPEGDHTLIVEARATEAEGRVSQAYSDSLFIVVQEPAKVQEVRTEERTTTRYVREERTRTILRENPDWTPTNGEPRQIETEYTYPVEIGIAQVEEVEVAEIRPGEYARAFGAYSREPVELDLSDPNVAAEIQRIEDLKQVDRERSRTVYYATNREVVDAGASDISRFGNDIGPTISYGSASVRIPPTHRYGDEIGTPLLDWFDNPQKHFRVTALNGLQEDAFYALMRNTLSLSDDSDSLTQNDVLLYVHGFRTTMEFALLRPAQISYDIDFKGKTCVFSWPSQGKALAYGEDQRNARGSVLALRTVLRKLLNGQTDGRVHILAHSMGNYLTLQALEQLADELADLDETDRPRLGHVILAAPDVWEEDFEKWTPRAVEIAKSVTLYHCSQDWALTASFLPNSLQRRAGLTAWPLRGLDNIDCDDANTEWLGHSAYADESPLLFDIQLLLQRDARPEGRPLRRLEDIKSGHPYWQAMAELAPEIDGP